MTIVTTSEHIPRLTLTPGIKEWCPVIPENRGINTLPVIPNIQGRTEGRTVTREADRIELMQASLELPFAATKSFIAQLAVFMEITNLNCQNQFDGILTHAHRSLEQAFLLTFTDAVRHCKGATAPLLYRP